MESRTGHGSKERKIQKIQKKLYHLANKYYCKIIIVMESQKQDIGA